MNKSELEQILVTINKCIQIQGIAIILNSIAIILSFIKYLT